MTDLLPGMSLRCPWRFSYWILLLLGVSGTVHALDWQSFPGGRRTAVQFAPNNPPGFLSLSPEVTGITFTNLLNEERGLTNQIFLNGSGVAAGDVDGDGLVDLYFCGLDAPNTLWRNLGNWRFENITVKAGVACADQASTGATLVDIDGDGDLDLLVNGISRGTRLFLNDGSGTFHETTAEAGLQGTSGSMSLTLADIDGDGWLDLYVINYRSDTMRDQPDLRFRAGVTNGVTRLLTVNGRATDAPNLVGRFTIDQRGGILENGEADTLYHNDGHGHFTAIPWTQGSFLDEAGKNVAIPYDWGLSAQFRDLNGDGAPDLYVCNDFQSPDRIWINRGNGTFQALPRLAIRQTSLFSMGVDFADVDRDGFDDIFVVDMLSREHQHRQIQVMGPAAFAQVRSDQDDRPQFSRNTLFHNRGNNTYAEVAQYSGIEASDWSWCPAFLDVDLDGYEDLLITTGHWRDAQNADIAQQLDDEKKKRSLSTLEQLRERRRMPRLDPPNVAFRNRGDLTFEEVGTQWGFDSRRISHGMALADLDNDGDLDVVINCLNEAPLVLRNNASRARIAVRLLGRSPNTRGVGAKISISAPGLPNQSQEMMCAGRYLSSDDYVRTFAAGNPTNSLTVTVLWRSGATSLVTNASPNFIYEIDEKDALPAKAANVAKRGDSTPSLPITPSEASKRPLFEDISARLNHIHQDEPFDDYARQPLLPRKLSQLGPGITWFDFNGDGWDDLIIGAGRGGRLAVFRNDTQGGFIPQRAKPLEAILEQDLTTVLAWRPNPTNALLLMGLSQYESGNTNGPGIRQFSMVTGETDEQLLLSASSTGPLALADFDGDGEIDAFVGGRVISGRYPEAASSAFLRSHHGQLRVDPVASRVLDGIGLVSGAVFTDLNRDGWPDLVLACDWGPIRILRNQKGKFSAWDPPVVSPGNSAKDPPSTRLSALTGWWNSVTAGDFDSDGRMDLIVGNWGRNQARQRFLDKPDQLYFGDVDGSGNLALLEAHYDSPLHRFVPTRDWATLGNVFPTLRERFLDFTAFSRASAADVLAAGLPSMRSVSLTTMESILLLNRGDHFEIRPLPMEAQFAPAFGMAVGDLDGDGCEDVFIAQNFFEVCSAESRQDAGCGLILKGDGHGNLKAMPVLESGLTQYGDGRGAALSDFDQDGRLDLAVTQNRGSTRLFHNSGAKPGLRVHLSGLTGNPQAIGSQIRCRFASGRIGPSHEIHVGAGYWSQDSTAMILGLPETPETLEIRWPEGIIESVPVPPGIRALSLKQPQPESP